MNSNETERQEDPLDGSALSPQRSESSPVPGEISAREAVRRAVGELGAEVEVEDVLAHVQGKYGLDPPRATALAYLSEAKKDVRHGAGLEPRRRGRSRKGAGNGHPACAPPVAAPAVEEVVDALEVLRELCDRLGDDNIHRLLDTL
jgi:hypothetical protein